MRIMVFDVPAVSGGALTILKHYYRLATEDKSNEWVFVVSDPMLIEHKNVKVHRYPWTKKSWFHRLYFDFFIAHRLIRKFHINEVISLQNVVLPFIKVKQTLYLHQALPFAEKKFKITEDYKFWIYQNIISCLIFTSIRNADKVIVQTKWMKKACLEEVNIDPTKIEVVAPIVSFAVDKYYEKEEGFRVFFYPSVSSNYKNHILILQAVKELVKNGYYNFKVIFTIHGKENQLAKELMQFVINNNLPVELIGQICQEKVYDYYCKSVLIFPSYIETFGLPLLEAKMHNTPIIASNCAFSHEILDDYDKVDFFDPFNKEELYSIMKRWLTLKL